jgi:hypothetical protein
MIFLGQLRLASFIKSNKIKVIQIGLHTSLSFRAENCGRIEKILPEWRGTVFSAGVFRSGREKILLVLNKTRPPNSFSEIKIYLTGQRHEISPFRSSS